MTKENLLKYLRDPAYLHQVSYQELKTLVAEYPNSLSLRYLLAIKSKQENNGDFDRQLAFLATYSIDRAHLFDIFNKEEELALQEDSVLLQEDFLELKELSALERELSTAVLVQAAGSKELEPAFLPDVPDLYKEASIKEVEIVNEQLEQEDQLEEDFYVLNFDEETELADNSIVTETIINDTQVANNLAEIEDLFKDLEEEETEEEDTIIDYSTNNSQLLQETLITGTFSDIPLEIIDTNVSIIGEASGEVGAAVTDKAARTVSIDYLNQTAPPISQKEKLETNEQNLLDAPPIQQVPELQQPEELILNQSKLKEQPIIYSSASTEGKDLEAITKETQQAAKSSIQKEETNSLIEEKSEKAIERITIFEKSTIISPISSSTNGIEAITNQDDHLGNELGSSDKESNVDSPSTELLEELGKEGLMTENRANASIDKDVTPDYLLSSDLNNQERETLVINNAIQKEERASSAVPIYVEDAVTIKPLPKSSFTTWYKKSPGNNVDFAGYDLVGFNSKGIIDEVTTPPEILPPPKEETSEKEADRTVTVRKVISKADKSLVFEEDIASETLAQLLVLQGHYSKATAMYEQLSLIFPEKSSLFANEIQKIENLEDEIA